MNLLDADHQAELAPTLLHTDHGHVSVPLRRLQSAEMLWVNADEARADPDWQAVGGTLAAYEANLLHCCAFRVADTDEAPDRMGVADRYGGGNIGTNGGSGRAALIGRYYVKGIGRTPLIGAGVDASHASGGAYLEECVRESMLAEILHRELPFGTVRTLAIIATGRVQVWQTENGPKPERCCLLVRRPFLRPAHLERAPLYRGAEALPGMVDAERVRSTIEALAGLAGGMTVLQDVLATGFERWSRQLAATHLLCLPHGGVSSSNVTLDGRLVDFGATAAVPSLARFWVASGNHPSGEEYRDIIDTVSGVACALRFTAGQGEPARHWRVQVCQRVMQAYGDSLRHSLVCLLGFSATQARIGLTGAGGTELARRLDAFLQRERRCAWPLFEGTPWDALAMPDPAHLQRLDDAALTAAGADMTAGLGQGQCHRSSDERRAVRERWCEPRVRLDRDRLKQECYERLDGRYPAAGQGQGQGQGNGPALRSAIEALVREVVTRESRVSLRDEEQAC